MAKATLGKKQREELLRTLQARFERNMERHKGLAWDTIRGRLEASPAALWSLSEMERTGGEPDVIGQEKKTGAYVFCDCSAESPKGRRSLCYNPAGQQKREKEGLRPGGNVLDMAAAMGVEPLDEEQYMELQALGEFDTKSQSWLMTPEDVARLGGAIFGERRFGRAFVAANTAPCFFGARGFRSLLRV